MNEGFSCPWKLECNQGDRTETEQGVFAGTMLCKRHCAKSFTLVDAFNLHSS